MVLTHAQLHILVWRTWLQRVEDGFGFQDDLLGYGDDFGV